jgi:hypothetical protein
LYSHRYSRKDAVLVGTAIMTDDSIKEDIWKYTELWFFTSKGI